MFWIRMALAQLGRRRLRTGILVSALALAYGVLLFFRGLADKGYDQLADLLVRTHSGHVVISAPGYFADPLPGTILNDTRELLRLLPEVRHVEERIFFQGFLKSSGQVAYFQRGTAAAWPSSLEHAELFSKVTHGSIPENGEVILLGHLLAEKLGIEVGDRLVLVFNGPFGTLEKSVTLTAILKTQDPVLDRGSVFVPLPAMRDWIRLPHGAHQVALFSSPGDASRLAEKVRALPFAADVHTWRENLPMAAQFIDYHSASVWVFQFIIFFIIAISIVDAFFMSMFERTRENGILRALGMPKKTLIRLVVTESLILGLGAGLLGLLLGSGAIWFGARVGIDPGWFTGEQGLEVAGGVFSGRIHARFPAWTVLFSWFGLVTLTVVSTLLPAIRAAGIPIVSALRQLK